MDRRIRRDLFSHHLRLGNVVPPHPLINRSPVLEVIFDAISTPDLSHARTEDWYFLGDVTQISAAALYSFGNSFF